jgi:hypothetical protein
MLDLVQTYLLKIKVVRLKVEKPSVPCEQFSRSLLKLSTSSCGLQDESCR